jgi:hypothetical protein
MEVSGRTCARNEERGKTWIEGSGGDLSWFNVTSEDGDKVDGERGRPREREVVWFSVASEDKVGEGMGGLVPHCLPGSQSLV